jgi:iron complex transport system ATP-binding protein
VPKLEKPIIALHNVSLEREGARILEHIHWEVRTGEHWAIIGQNGAGKTLLLKMIATYLWPTRGRIEVLGCEFGKIELQRLRKRISWVSSAPEQELPQDQSVLDVVASGYYGTLRLFYDPPRHVVRRARKLLRLLGLQKHEEQSFATLSVGEKKKALIARAMIQRPRLLILDEVCAGLDPVARKRYLDSLRLLIKKESNICVLFVTHHIEEIFPEITHLLGLKKGRVIFSGRKEAILTTKNMISIFGENVKLRKAKQLFFLDVI